MRPWSTRRAGPLQVELSLVARLRDLGDFFENELANAHAANEFNGKWADVPDLQAQPCSVLVRVLRVVPEARVNGRGSDVNPEAEPRHATFALYSGAQTGRVGQVEPLQRPSENEVVGRHRVEVIALFLSDQDSPCVLLLQVGAFEARLARPEPGRVLADVLIALGNLPTIQRAI